MFSCQTVVQPDVLWSSGRERWAQRYLRDSKNMTSNKTSKHVLWLQYMSLWRQNDVKTWRQSIASKLHIAWRIWRVMSKRGVKHWRPDTTSKNGVKHDVKMWGQTWRQKWLQHATTKNDVKKWRQTWRTKLRQNSMTKHDVKTWPWNMSSSVAIEVRLAIVWCQEYGI